MVPSLSLRPAVLGLNVKIGVLTDFKTPLADGLEVEEDMFAAACDTADKMEGTSAFLEKRKPEFKGQ